MKSAARPSRTEAELSDAAGHVGYEVDMICFIVEHYPSIIGSPAVDNVENMALESFLVHYRNVRDFLCPVTSTRQPDPGDRIGYQRALDSVLAFDFNQGWQEEAKDWKEVVPNERERINKQLSHISYSRSQLNPKWPLPEMKNALVNVFREFLKSLPDERQQYFFQPTRWLPRALW